MALSTHPRLTTRLQKEYFYTAILGFHGLFQGKLDLLFIFVCHPKIQVLKLSIDSFHPIRLLGEGGFGKVILVKKKVSDRTDHRFAFKVMKKSRCSVSYNVSEKEALILACGHPFIMTLCSCFQTKVIFNFLNLLHISRESLILKFTISLKM